MRRVNVSGIISTVARDATGDGGAPTAAFINQPYSVAVDSAGDVFIADYDGQRIREINHATGLITTVAGDGTAGFAGDGGQATAAQLDYPRAVAVDAAGNVYIADTSDERIRKINMATGVITTVAGNGSVGFSGDGGPATAAELDFPEALTVDTAGDIFIADTDNQRIREVNAVTGNITTVAGNGTAGYNGDSQAATAAELNYPDGVAVDSSGNVYIADSSNYRIRKVNTAARLAPSPATAPSAIRATAGRPLPRASATPPPSRSTPRAISITATPRTVASAKLIRRA